MIIEIVILDDHQLFLDGFCALLDKHNDINVLIATTNIQKAFKVIEAKKPHLVITDISMPEMSGVEFIALLKQQQPNIKIMVLSMFANIQSYKDIDAYLLKETDESELILAIKEVVIKDNKYLKVVENKNENIVIGNNNVLLTKREKEIIRLIIKEHNTGEIAEKLFISSHTVMTHRKNIFFKLNVKNIAGLTKKALQLGIS